MKLRWPKDAVLKRANRGLLGVIVLCNGYVIIWPQLPKLTFAVSSHITKPVKVSIDDDASLKAISRDSNHILIPRLQLDKKIYDGKNPNTVNLGIWRRPNTSQPGHSSNTVLVGHRFTYNGKSVFYNLDKLKPGDDLVVAWDGLLYIYKVDAQSVVEPSEVAVEAPTTAERLTLYTCTPLWSAKQRLVITANLERVL